MPLVSQRKAPTHTNLHEEKLIYKSYGLQTIYYTNPLLLENF